jgi:hypothetical protein
MCKPFFFKGAALRSPEIFTQQQTNVYQIAEKISTTRIISEVTQS